MSAAAVLAPLLLPLLAVPAPVAVARVNTTDTVVALTFDACATATQRNGFDEAVFAILKRERIPATVFLSGRWIDAHPDAAQALAREAQLELGNHTWAHPRLSALSDARVLDELRRADRRLADLGRKALLLRPPAGDWNGRVVRLARSRGLTTILWDVVSGDAGGHVPPAKMVKTVLDGVRTGSIVIFHINGRGPFTKDALPEIIAGLRDKGLRFVTVSQLLDLPGATPVPALQNTRVPPKGAR